MRSGRKAVDCEADARSLGEERFLGSAGRMRFAIVRKSRPAPLGMTVFGMEWKEKENWTKLPRTEAHT
jgi:hypothetical protein